PTRAATRSAAARRNGVVPARLRRRPDPAGRVGLPAGLARARRQVVARRGLLTWLPRTALRRVPRLAAARQPLADFRRRGPARLRPAGPGCRDAGPRRLLQLAVARRAVAIARSGRGGRFARRLGRRSLADPGRAVLVFH